MKFEISIIIIIFFSFQVSSTILTIDKKEKNKTPIKLFPESKYYYVESKNSVSHYSYIFDTEEILYLKVSIGGKETGKGSVALCNKECNEENIIEQKDISSDKSSIIFFVDTKITYNFTIEYDYDQKHNLLIEFNSEDEKYYKTFYSYNKVNDFYTLKEEDTFCFIYVISELEHRLRNL